MGGVWWEVGVVLVSLSLDDDADDDVGVKTPREDPDGEAIGENAKFDVDPAISQDMKRCLFVLLEGTYLEGKAYL